MLLGLPPARYVVLPHYEAKLKQLLETANDMDAGLPLEYEITTLEVSLLCWSPCILQISCTSCRLLWSQQQCMTACDPSSTHGGSSRDHVHMSLLFDKDSPSCAVFGGVYVLQEGQELELPTGFWVRPFPTVHPVPSQVGQKTDRRPCSVPQADSSWLRCCSRASFRGALKWNGWPACTCVALLSCLFILLGVGVCAGLHLVQHAQEAET